METNDTEEPWGFEITVDQVEGGPERSPGEGDPRPSSFGFDPSDPPVDYQPESGQPGVREPLDVAERDEDDDL